MLRAGLDELQGVYDALDAADARWRNAWARS
jgi:hypothetical protein